MSAARARQRHKAQPNVGASRKDWSRAAPRTVLIAHWVSFDMFAKTCNMLRSGQQLDLGSAMKHTSRRSLHVGNSSTISTATYGTCNGTQLETRLSELRGAGESLGASFAAEHFLAMSRAWRAVGFGTIPIWRGGEGGESRGATRLRLATACLSAPLQPRFHARQKRELQAPPPPPPPPPEPFSKQSLPQSEKRETCIESSKYRWRPNLTV